MCLILFLRHGSIKADVKAKLKQDWKRKLGGQLTAPVAADDKVFVARKGGKFASVSAKDGKILHEQDLVSPPVFDGMAAAYGSVFMSLRDGTVVRYK